jgi:threonine dehydratase
VELLEDLPEVDTAIVPVAGGDLLIGIAVALKAANPSTKVIGVSMERGAALIPGLRAGRPVDYVEQPTLADALMGGLYPDPERVLEEVGRHIDDMAMVSEEEIAGAMAFALEEHHQVVEGGSATCIAALLYQKLDRLNKNVAVVVTGGNVDMSLLLDITQEHRKTTDGLI